MSNGNNNGHHRNGTGNGLVHANSLPRTGYGGNGHKPDAAIVTEPELLWDGLSPVVTKALGQPLDPALVSQRRGRAGRTYDYLEGHVVIEQANNIFARGGWGYDIVGDVTLRRDRDRRSQDGRGEARPSLLCEGHGQRPRRALAHRRGFPRSGRGDRRGPRNGV